MGKSSLNRAIVSTLFAGALIAPANASAAVLYDQTTGTAGFPVQSAHFVTPNQYDSDAADDFTVPAGVTWTVASVDVVGQEPTSESANIVIFGEGATRPGPELFRQGGIPFPPGDAGNLPLSGAPPLVPGHYWISVYTTWTSASFNWRAQDPVNGSPAVWENPPNGDGTGCTTFTPLTQCAPGVGSDMMFRLNGDAIPIVVHHKRCKRKKHKRAAVAKKKHCKKKRKH